MFENEQEASRFEEKNMYPLMVKGLRKGAIKCDDAHEAIAARRAMLRNPANQGQGGGVYVESFIEGEEHSYFILTGSHGESIATFTFLKLATTQLGTTLAGQVDQERPSAIQPLSLSAEICGPLALELEWRKDQAGNQWLFEVNARFPSWIGALGAYGLNFLEAHINCVVHRPTPPVFSNAPREGSIFYRLPQSGFLPMETVFSSARNISHNSTLLTRYTAQLPLLWKSCSPHEFRMK
jgi:biotin carboxylase